jgi:hypothetical protein
MMRAVAAARVLEADEEADELAYLQNLPLAAVWVDRGICGVGHVEAVRVRLCATEWQVLRLAPAPDCGLGI